MRPAPNNVAANRNERRLSHLESCLSRYRAGPFRIAGYMAVAAVGVVGALVADAWLRVRGF